MVPQLTDCDGDLYFGDDIILVRYPGGDCDSICWPFGRQGLPSYSPERERKNLASALYDMYEMGEINERTVVLPDGTAFNIDNELAR